MMETMADAAIENAKSSYDQAREQIRARREDLERAL